MKLGNLMRDKETATPNHRVISSWTSQVGMASFCTTPVIAGCLPLGAAGKCWNKMVVS